jgi:putative ABC transport system permease protein
MYLGHTTASGCRSSGAFTIPGCRAMKALLPDCRHAIRLYARTPGPSLIAIAVLAVAMAFVTAFLSLYVDLVLRPHPGFEQSARLVTLGQNGGPSLLGLPYSMFERIAEEVNAIDAVAIATPANALIEPDREPVNIEMVSAQFFEGLRPRLALGRGFLADEHAPDAEPVAVISYGLWQRRFGGDSGVLDTTLELTRDPSNVYWGLDIFEANGRTIYGTFASEPEQETTRFRIVGVMSDDLPGLSQGETAIWLAFDRAFPLFVGVAGYREMLRPMTYVRRRDGVSAAAIVGELEARYVDADDGIALISGTRLDGVDGIVRDFDVQRDAKRQLNMFLAGSVLLALVAAANVSLFLLARAPGRRRELGIRMAVGAPLGRLARQLAAEAGLLVAVAAALGLMLSVWLSAFLRGLAIMRDAEWRNVTLLDWRVLALAAALVLALTMLVSLAPMLTIRHAGIEASSRVATARASLAQRLAGVAQIGIAGALGGAAIGFGWYLGAMLLGDPGYATADRYVARYRLPGVYPGASLEMPVIETARRREIIETIPGVTAVAFGRPIPGDEDNLFASVQIPRPDDPFTLIDGQRGSFDSRFIDVLGLNLLYGRPPEDNESGVLVNQTMARALWGRDDVVGEPLPGANGPRPPGSGPEVAPEVIGVLADLSFTHPAAAILPYVFGTSASVNAGAFIIEAQLSAAALQQELDRVREAGELDIIASDIRPFKAVRADQLAPDRARGLLTISTATLVVILAALGFYGTQRYLVAAGRREYAIRAALGAGPRALGRVVVRRGLLLGFPGLVLGGLLAFIVVAWLRDDYLSKAVSPAVVTVYLLAGLLALLLAASLGPAREAQGVHPAALLRED